MAVTWKHRPAADGVRAGCVRLRYPLGDGYGVALIRRFGGRVEVRGPNRIWTVTGQYARQAMAVLTPWVTALRPVFAYYLVVQDIAPADRHLVLKAASDAYTRMKMERDQYIS